MPPAPGRRSSESRFNGRGAFLTALNAPQGPGGLEVTPGVDWLTLRSDGNDKFAQPTGVWIGRPNEPTNIGASGPALAGARNAVLPGADHRETSYGPAAFAETWRFITGSAPVRSDVLPEPRVLLDGRVTALLGPAQATQTNRPLPGARVDVHAVDPASGERLGPAQHSRVVGADGQWGPFTTRPDAFHEFVITADGYATLHIYRSPFPRSSALVHLRPVRIADADRAAGAVVTLSRPRGYLDARRDRMSLDGKPPPGIPPGVAGVATARLALPAAAPRTVVAEFNPDSAVGRVRASRDAVGWQGATTVSAESAQARTGIPPLGGTTPPARRSAVRSDVSNCRI